MPFKSGRLLAALWPKDLARRIHVEALVETNYSIDTFYFLVMGAGYVHGPGLCHARGGPVRAKKRRKS